MNKKKLAIVSLSIAMMMTAFTGLTACNPDDPEPEPQPKPPVTITKEDTRTNAYTAYSVSGTKLGEYKTIAAAINAAVEEDADTGDIGSYVTKTGGTTKLFVNRAGYSSGMDDTFWYYTDGNKLEGMLDWEADSISYLQNNKVITHEVSGWGTKSVQSWNGYGLLDENGKLLDANTVAAQSWELSSTMDAAMIQLAGRLKGVSGMNYEIDLSNVKITPPYDGADDTYAFLGFYSWQDYYVIVTGIACNTRTGDWYAFEATSRDDSFSDATYNIGKKLMSSTWNESGGYFKPDCSSVSMSIITTVQEDDEGEYQVNKMKVTFSDGTEYARDIDESTVNEFFSGAKIGYENAYAFVAGLDIVNEVVSGVKTENTDYFNGSTFENLTITAATAHIADETELSTTKYGYSKSADPGDYDILLASTATKLTRGIAYDYTILNTYACTSYVASNGKDVYSFRYDGDPVVDDDYGPTASVYQTAIDELAKVTADNALNYEDAIKAVGAWYGDDAGTGTTISMRYWNVLDFTNYLAAKEILATSVQISDEALAVANELNALGNILNYTCKGWTTDAEETVGYLYSEIEKFRAIKAKFDALSSEDQTAIFYRYEKTAFETWQQLSADLETLMASSAFTNEANVFHSYETPTSRTAKDYDNEAALGYLFYLAIKTSRTDDPWTKEVENDYSDGTGSAVMDFDNNAFPSIWICQAVDYFESIGVTLPTYLQDKLEEIGFEDFYYGAYYPIYNTVALAQRIGSGEIESPTDITEKELAFLNEVWVSSYSISAQISWNWVSGNRFETYYAARTVYIAFVAGGTLTTEDGTAYATYQYFAVVANYLESLGYEINVNGWGVTADTIELTASDSDAAKAVVASINALTDLDGYTLKGWSTDGEDISGYLYNEVLNYNALVESYGALSGAEKIYVSLNADMDLYKAWAAVAEEVNAMLDLLADVSVELYSGNSYTNWHGANDVIGDQTKEELTGERVVAKFVYYLCTIANSGAAASGDDQFINAAIMQMYLDCLNGIDGLALPEMIANVLDNLNGYTAFYNDYYLPIYKTVQIANRILADTLKTLPDLTDEELAFLNKYWVSSYDVSATAAAWQWNSGAHFKAYHSARTAYIVRVAGGTLTAVPEGSSATCVTDYYFTVLGGFLSENGYTLNANGWGVTSAAITRYPLSDGAMALIEMYGSMYASTDVKAYSAWGSTETWATEGYEGVTVKGYLYYEVKTYALIAEKYAALEAGDQESYLLTIGMTADEWAEWLAGWKSVSEQVDAMLKKLENTSFVTYTGNSYNNWNSAKDVIGDQGTETLTGERVLAKFMYYLGVVANSGLAASNDEQFINAAIMQMYLDCLNSVEGFELPDCIASVLYSGTINYTSFYNDYYLPIYYTVQIANKILDGTVKSLSDLTEEELAFLNKYWVSSYDVSATAAAWQWNSGHHFKDYHDARTAYIVRVAGGTLTAVPEGSSATCVTDYYFTVLGNFLVGLGYTLNANGWGVTANTIG